MNVRVYFRRRRVNAYFALCLECWAVGRPAKRFKIALKWAQCNCKEG